MKYITCVMGHVNDYAAREREKSELHGITMNYCIWNNTKGWQLQHAQNPLGDTRWASANVTRSLHAMFVHSSQGLLVQKFIPIFSDYLQHRAAHKSL